MNKLVLMILPLLATVLLLGCTQQSVACGVDGSCPAGHTCQAGTCVATSGTTNGTTGGTQYPQTVNIANVIPTDRDGNPLGTALTNGATTTDRIFHVQGTVQNPAFVPTTAQATETPGEFNGRLVLMQNNQPTEVALTQTQQGQWAYDQAIVLQQGQNTLQFQVENLVGSVVGQSQAYTVNANIPRNDIRVELTWDTNYNDVDMHLFDAGGKHTYYSAQNTQESSNAIPCSNLDVDDTDGYGPEVFTMEKADTGTYRVCINYYSDHSVSTPVTATVRVTIAEGQAQVYTHTFQPTDAISSSGNDCTGTDGHTWTAATFTVPGATGHSCSTEGGPNSVSCSRTPNYDPLGMPDEVYGYFYINTPQTVKFNPTTAACGTILDQSGNIVSTLTEGNNWAAFLSTPGCYKLTCCTHQETGAGGLSSSTGYGSLSYTGGTWDGVTCTRGSSGATCAIDADCAAGMVCQSGSCVPGGANTHSVSASQTPNYDPLGMPQMTYGYFVIDTPQMVTVQVNADGAGITDDNYNSVASLNRGDNIEYLSVGCYILNSGETMGTFGGMSSPGSATLTYESSQTYSWQPPQPCPVP